MSNPGDGAVSPCISLWGSGPVIYTIGSKSETCFNFIIFQGTCQHHTLKIFFPPPYHNTNQIDFKNWEKYCNILQTKG